MLGFRLRGEEPVPPIETTIGNAKSMPNGIRVSISNAALTAKTGAVGPGFFYIESTDRTAGIRVIGETQYPVGRLLKVTGTLTKIGNERAIQLEALSSDGIDNPVSPIFMVIRSVGGSALAGSAGLNNVGLLVKVVGEVVSSEGISFIIKDGYGNLTCRIAEGITGPTPGSFVAVTGIISLEDESPVILVRSQQDIQDILPLF